jgi:ferredoxin
LRPCCRPSSLGGPLMAAGEGTNWGNGDNGLPAASGGGRFFLFIFPNTQIGCTRSLCYVCMYCMYVCMEDFVLYEYVYGIYRHTHRSCLHGATRYFYVYVYRPYDDECD